MTALEEIKKALAAAEQFIVNGVELGYVRMPDPETPDSAHDTLPMIRQAQTALESLQRENEELRADVKREAELATHMANDCNDAQARAEAAEAEVKRLRNKVAARALTDKQLADEIEAIDEACKGGFGEGGGSPGEWWYERADELEHERKRRELESQLQQHNSRTALASTGGEHHGN